MTCETSDHDPIDNPLNRTGPRVMFTDNSLVISSNEDLISEETRLSRKSSIVCMAFNKLAGYEKNSPLVVGRMESLDPRLSTAIKKTKEIAKIH